jgi:hypothetical protein
MIQTLIRKWQCEHGEHRWTLKASPHNNGNCAHWWACLDCEQREFLGLSLAGVSNHPNQRKPIQ